MTSEMTNNQLARAVKQIKYEIATAHLKVDASEVTNKCSKKCKNALDGSFYPFEKGSSEEKELYRVMPVDGPEKLYFNSEREYDYWTKGRSRT